MEKKKKRKAKPHLLLFFTNHPALSIRHYPLLFICPVRTYQPLRPSFLSLACPQLLRDTLVLITSTLPASTSPTHSLFLPFSSPAQIHLFPSSVLVLADASKHPAQSPLSWYFCCVAIPFLPKFETHHLPSPSWHTVPLATDMCGCPPPCRPSFSRPSSQKS